MTEKVPISEPTQPVRGRVQLLDPHTINQIAAGEVVERPASVVKELVENALDAGAQRIEIELTDAGKTLIRVSDDGCGMTPQDARASLLRHATSKITSAHDLLSVATLGFRGEAIPSIASVSHFRISTGTEDGTRFVLESSPGGQPKESWGSGPRGTDITAADLFGNVPARLKFLKSEASELSAILDYVTRHAMISPHVAFRVIHNGRESIRTTGNGDLYETIADLWGRDTARAMAETLAEGPRFRVVGFVSPPHLTKATRSQQFLYVNGRPVRSRTVTAALDQAYRDLTPEKRYPMVVLNLIVDPELVDVNVSPTKSEVKFQSESLAFDAIRAAVRTALLGAGMMPDAAGIAVANEALRSLSSDPLPGFDPAGLLGVSFAAPAAADPGPMAPGPSRYPFASLVEGLRVIGQAMNTFIIAETARGIVVIDQHVAHERVLYEYLCGLKGASAIETQALLEPETLHLDRGSAALLEERLGEVRAVGFDVEPFGGASFVLRSAPAALRGKDPVRVLKDLIDDLALGGKLVPTREQIWIMSSCKMAVKAGDPLSHAEMEKLIADLATTENPYLCPHGRPITITLHREDLLRKFDRA